MKTISVKTVEDYIKTFPKNTQELLKKVRQTIIDNAPTSIESISYGMPAYKTNKKPLVYFAAHSKHIGFYATPSGHEKFAKQLSQYKQGKGSVQFPFNKPIPYDIIADIVRFKVAENENKK